MPCSTEVEYISIHERRGKPGRPRGSIYTEEEQNNFRKACLKHYYNNYEYCTFQHKLSKQNARRVKQDKETNDNNDNNNTNNDN